MDGQENPVVAIEIPVKIWQFHQYITVWHYVIDPLMLTVNNQVLASFTPEDQEIVKMAATQAAKEQLAVVRKGLIAPDLSAFDILKENGMEVTFLSDEAKAAFKEKTAPVRDKWTETVGPDLVKKADAAIKSSR